MPVEHAPAGSPDGGRFVAGSGTPAHSHHGSGHHGGHHGKEPAPTFAELQQWLKDKQAGKKLTARQEAALHAAHEAHLAHMAHEEKLAADAKAHAAAGAGARTAGSAAPAAAPTSGPASGNTAHAAAMKGTWSAPGNGETAPAEQRFVLGIAYQAGPQPCIAKGQDGGRDYFTEAELEKAAHSYLRNGPRVGLFHMDGTDDAATATVVESYIYRNEVPWDLGDGLVVRKGDWVVGAVLSPEAWQLYKSGRITGWSMQGVARRRRPGREAA